jgi:hypothetical protein
VRRAVATNPSTHWPVAAAFSDAVSAHVIIALLETEGVPTQLIVGNPLLGPAQTCEIRVPPGLLHRARWILASAPLSDAELTFLATGELEGNGNAEE